MRKCFSVVIMFLLTALLLGGPTVVGQALREQAEPNSQTVPISAEDAALRTAASQYEIIEVLLAEGRYAEVADEFAVIVGLGLGGEREILVTQAAWDIAAQLREKGEYEIAHKIVDGALGIAIQPENRFSLLMMRGKIYKDQQFFGLAIQAHREAQRLGVTVDSPRNPESRERDPR